MARRSVRRELLAAGGMLMRRDNISNNKKSFVRPPVFWGVNKV